MSILSPDGIYRGIRPWSGRSTWLAQVDELLASTAGDELRRELRVGIDRVRAVARADARTATTTSGRDVGTANATVARRVGASVRVVQRARAWLERMGLARTVVMGRYLWEHERETLPGRVRVASTRALTTVDKPRRARTRVSANLSSGAQPRRGSASPDNHLLKTKTKQRSVENGEAPEVRPIWLQRLGAALDRRMPWLVPEVRPSRDSRGRHIGLLLNGLAKHNLHPGTTATALLDAIHARGPVRDVSEQRDPLAYFLALIDDDLVHSIARTAEATRCASDGHRWHGPWDETCLRCGIERPDWRDDRDGWTGWRDDPNDLDDLDGYGS